MSNRLLSSNNTSESDIQPPPTLIQVAERDQTTLRHVRALNSGESVADPTSVVVQEEAEQLLTKNVTDSARVLQDHERAIDILKEDIAKLKGNMSLFEPIFAMLLTERFSDHEDILRDLRKAIEGLKESTDELEADSAVFEAIHGN
ncbi:hypothetical protein GYMLUDRAFT_41735 [Collybiopsis luxurians FD-317 M1]|uniref:Uncharacterized protein n=1 Tax=Collybiopsis luxurians FD-317 M1 TaxID=944289 RepID=A0A0D0BG39_9AGAR|nr:hypothetical protein GYMLUDRAFT_41735 [Collybiopsis luxurians FD-317 M1]